MTIGIVGGGQLGRMLALAGYPLGLDFLFLDRSDNTPGNQVAPSLVGDFTDRRLLRKLAARSEVITFDWENISVESLRALGRSAKIAPPLLRSPSRKIALPRSVCSSSSRSPRRATPR